MLKKYRESSIKAKLIVFISLVALTAAYTLSFNPEWFLIATGGATAALVAIHLLVSYPRFFRVSLILIFQIFAVIYVALIYAGVYGSVFGTDVVLAILSSSVILFVASLIVLYITVNFGRGRVGRNLILAYLLLDVSGLAIGVYVTPYYMVALLIASICGIGYALLRTIKIFGRKKSEESLKTRDKMFSIKADKKAKTLISKNSWSAFKTEQNKNFWVVNAKRHIFIVVAIELHENLRKSKNGYMYEDVPLENVFNEIIEDSNKVSNLYKIPKSKTTLVILDISNRYPVPAKGYQEYELAPRGDKGNIKSKFIVTNNYGFNMLPKKFNNSITEAIWNKIVKV